MSLNTLAILNSAKKAIAAANKQRSRSVGGKPLSPDSLQNSKQGQKGLSLLVRFLSPLSLGVLKALGPSIFKFSVTYVSCGYKKSSGTAANSPVGVITDTPRKPPKWAMKATLSPVPASQQLVTEGPASHRG